ncbi:MAG: ABC transporter ATP-binding protein [Candidatus Saccharimonadales bacterium]
MKKAKKSINRRTISLFWKFTKKNEKYFWLGTFGAGFGVFIQDIIPPIIIANAFNILQSTPTSELSFSDFKFHVFIYGLLMLISVGLWRTQVWFMWQYEVKALEDISRYIFNHLQRMGASFHANRFGGSLVSQTNKFLGGYERVMDEFTWSVVTGVVSYITSMIILAFVAPFYALVFVCVSSVYFSIMSRRTIRTMKYDRALSNSESDRTAKLADMITNVSAVTTYAGEDYENELFKKQTKITTKKYMELLNKVMINDIVSHTMTNSIAFLSFFSGVLAITLLNAPAGVLYLAVNYSLQLTRRLWESNRVLRNFNRAFGDASDMTEILSIQPDIRDKEDAVPLNKGRGDIKLNSVDFYYPEQQDEVLFSGLNIHIKPGEKIGLVGKSGSGKTTLTKLLLRLNDISSGEILIDGQNVMDVTQRSLRESISYVPQEPLMFHRSIAENIRYGNPRASNKAIEAAAKMANAYEFIVKLADGFETLVGERGVKLSGGQRQRIAIARAMLKNAPILLLDEATSALDSESELLIQEALWKLMEGRTAIVIAHRLSTIQKMDRIIVMDNGKIIEQGTHKELSRSDGIYAELWNHQSGGFINS